MAENCNSNCSSCGKSCPSRDKQSLLKPLHKMSQVKKVIAVVSGKGGVGKSMTCALLAAAAQESGRVTAKTLRGQAETLMAPYVENGVFAFLEVRG